LPPIKTLAHSNTFSTVGFIFAPNFIQKFYTVLKKRLWESCSTPTLATFCNEKYRSKARPANWKLSAKKYVTLVFDIKPTLYI
jgi:hypothetical protein